MKINQRSLFLIFVKNLVNVLITVLKKTMFLFAIVIKLMILIIVDVLYTVLNITSNILDFIYG